MVWRIPCGKGELGMVARYDLTRERVKIATIALCLVSACVLTYWFHVVRGTGTVFTHFFYIPILLAAVWWKRKGVWVAVFLAALVVGSHMSLRVGVETANDYVRAVMFIVVALVVAGLTERLIRAEWARSYAAAELDQVFKTAGNALRVIDTAYNMLRTNKAFLKLAGVTQKEVEGRKCHEVLTSSLCQTPRCPLAQIMKGRDYVECDVEEQRSDGLTIPCVLTATPFYAPDGKLVGIVEDLRDITERKQYEERLLKLNRMYWFLSQINQTIVRIRDRDELLRRACHIAVEQELFRMVWVGMVDADTSVVKPVAHAGEEGGYVERLRIAATDVPEGRGPTGTAIREGRYVVCNDIASDPMMEPWRQTALESGYGSCASFPLKVDEEVIGAFVVYSDHPGFFAEEETDLLVQMADDISFALQSIEHDAQRRQAEGALRESEEFSSSLLTNAPYPTVVVEEDTSIRYVNPAFEQLAGFSSAEVVGTKAPYPWWREETIDTLRKTLKDGMREGLDHVELLFQKKNGQSFWVEVTSTAVRSEGGLRYYLSNWVDITERKYAQERLRDSEERYRTIFATTGTATIILEEDTTISLANEEFERLSGYTREELEDGTRSWTAFIVPDDVGRLKYYHTMRRRDPDSVPTQYECRFIDRHGTMKDIFMNVSMIPGTMQSVASFLDITHRKQAEKALQESEEQLRYLSSQLIMAEENERKRMAHELHDGLGQTLTAVKFSIEHTVDLIKEDPETGPPTEKLAALVPLVQNGINEVRRICADLRPAILDDLGILATTGWVCREFQAIYSGIHITQEIDIHEDDVSRELKTVIYRIIQEALNNIAKHSGADFVRLSLSKKGSTIWLSVEDNGRGFDVGRALSVKERRRGIGLASMRERAELSGGSFSVTSKIEGGTRIQASWQVV
jgi:PAS domain S-box-containing protein